MSQTNIAYDYDFYAWSIQNARLMRQGKLSEIDVENIAEELESMAKRDRRELISRLTVLLMHLLKWQFQPDKRSRSWELTIDEQRDQITLLLTDSPSLKHQLEERIANSYRLALKKAMKETCLPKNSFPTDCPYTLEQIIADDFYPERGGG